MCCEIPVKLPHFPYNPSALPWSLLGGGSLFRKKGYLALCAKGFAIKEHTPLFYVRIKCLNSLYLVETFYK